MSVEQHPVNFRTYYKNAKEVYNKKKEEALEKCDKLTLEVKALHDDIKSRLDIYEKEFNVKFTKYSEFNNNEYIDGSLLRACKNLFFNKNGNYELKGELYDVYNYALKQSELHDLKHKIDLYDKILNLNLKEYNTLLRIYYTEVQKKLVLEGAGYAFEGYLGWICYNRFKVSERSKARHIDFQKTKERRAQLIKEGKKIYNKEEAEWCAKNGFEYKAEDARVFISNEYAYELCLIHSYVKNGRKLRLEVSDYRSAKLRGKSNNKLIEECDGDVNKIMNLGLDMQTKINMCTKVDKMLYLKFIRNDNQESLTNTAHSWKNRQ